MKKSRNVKKYVNISSNKMYANNILFISAYLIKGSGKVLGAKAMNAGELCLGRERFA